MLYDLTTLMLLQPLHGPKATCPTLTETSGLSRRPPPSLSHSSVRSFLQRDGEPTHSTSDDQSCMASAPAVQYLRCSSCQNRVDVTEKGLLPGVHRNQCYEPGFYKKEKAFLYIQLAGATSSDLIPQSVRSQRGEFARGEKRSIAC